MRLFGSSEFAILIYGSEDPALDLDALAEALGRRGWQCTRILRPKAIHLSLNPVHARSAEAYLEALNSAAGEVRAQGLKGEEDRRTY